MTRNEIDFHIQSTYGVVAERLFASDPTTAVYRHPGGRKWFAVIMELAPCRLGLEGKELITVINLKVDPLLGEILRTKECFYPAYHMNKEKWISAEISERSDPLELYGLIAMSFRLTKTKKDIETQEKRMNNEDH